MIICVKAGLTHDELLKLKKFQGFSRMNKKTHQQIAGLVLAYKMSILDYRSFRRFKEFLNDMRLSSRYISMSKFILFPIKDTFLSNLVVRIDDKFFRKIQHSSGLKDLGYACEDGFFYCSGSVFNNVNNLNKKVPPVGGE